MSILGHEGTLTIGSEVTRIRDLTLSLTASEVDITTRADDGWRARRAGLREWGAEFELLAVSGDIVWDSLENAFTEGSNLTATIADYLGHSVSGTVYVTSFTRNEPLDGAVTANVTLVGAAKPTIG